MKVVKLKAIPVRYNESEFYVSTISAKELFSLSMVTRAEEDPENGYQRVLGKGRAKKIAEYLEDGHMIPGSLILSSKEKNAIYDSETNELTLSAEPASLLVIDGQHRLYGAYQANIDVQLPICLFFGLDKATEVQYFLDVNGFQMGVPKTLRLELEKFTAEEDSEEILLRKLFDEMDENPASPLCGKMSRTKSVSGKISHVAFQNGIKPLLGKSPFNSFSLEQKKKVLVNFLLALETTLIELFEESKKISNSAFFQSMMGAFPDICHVTYANFSSYKQIDFERTMQSLSKVNWENHQGTNNAAIKQLTDDVIQAISSKNKVNDDVF